MLDNGHFGETGMQPSHSSLGANLADVARGFGIENVFEARSIEDAALVGKAVETRSATTFVQVHIDLGEPPRALPPRDGVAVKNRFRAGLGLPTF